MAALCFERISCAYETVVRVMEMSEAVVVEVMATMVLFYQRAKKKKDKTVSPSRDSFQLVVGSTPP